MIMERMGNILMVANYPSDTAYAWWLMEQFWNAIAEMFEARGKKAFLSYPKITSLSDTIKNSPIEAVELVVPWRSAEQRELFEQFVKDNNISFIYFTDQSYFNMQYLSMRRYGIKRIVNHDHTPGDRPPVRGMKGLIKAARNSIPMVSADKVFCVSELMRTRSIENERIPANKCVVIQNGITPVACIPKEKSSTRRRLGVKDDAILICTSGRAHPYKRFDFVIDCAKKLTEIAPDLDFCLLIAGDGPEMPALTRKLDDLDLSNHVKLLGFRNDVHELLCASDIAIHAALGEGFSLSILEYMSAGLPVICPDIPSVSQAIRENETGLLYPADDCEAVAGHMLFLASNEQERHEMGSKAQADVSSQYTFEGCLAALIHEAEQVYT